MQYLNKKIAILGLGIETLDLLDWLKTNSFNCQITIFDQKSKSDIKVLPKGKYHFSLGKNYLKTDLSSFDIIFRSPGFYRLDKRLLKAEKNGVSISSTTKLFFDLCPSRIIGVTGTKGKGTTTSLIHQIIESSGKTSYLAGNIGKPMLKLLPKLKKNDWVCLELSSFQLQDLDKSPHIAVLLNVTSEHLDVHQSTHEYRQAKTNILSHQQASDFSVINGDYKVTKDFVSYTQAKVHFFSKNNLDLDTSKIKLRGQHNLENIAAAITVANIIGINERHQLKAIYNFKGLEHRIKLVRTIKKIKFYNDSFSTTPETAIAALRSFHEPTTIILGGSDKGSDFTDLGKEIVKSRHLKTIILIGQMSSAIKKAIDQAGVFQGEYLTGLNSMKEIVDKAYQNAHPGQVILLSPSCASFDMFDNYKARGEQFIEYVNKLK